MNENIESIHPETVKAPGTAHYCHDGRHMAVYPIRYSKTVCHYDMAAPGLKGGCEPSRSVVTHCIYLMLCLSRMLVGLAYILNYPLWITQNAIWCIRDDAVKKRRFRSPLQNGLQCHRWGMFSGINSGPEFNLAIWAEKNKSVHKEAV